MKNKKKIFTIFLGILLCGGIVAYFFVSTRSTVSYGIVKSEILKESRNYSVYLPPGYYAFSNRNREYPVLYLLHGFSDNHLGWMRHGNLRKITDEMIQSGRIDPMIIVVPHTLGGFYGNRSDGSYRYEDYFFEEFIPFIETKYRVRREKAFRSIAGVSMGGNGALLYALKHPEMFTACCTMGAAVNFSQHPPETGSPSAENDIESLFQKTALQRKEPGSETSTVRFLIDCGREDGLYRTNEKIDTLMTGLEIPHVFLTRTGRHDWDCWRAALPDTLEFVNRPHDESPP